MFAVIKTGGKQYSVESGKTLKIEKVEGKKGDSLSFNQVILISNTNEQIFGNPLIIFATFGCTMGFLCLPTAGRVRGGAFLAAVIRRVRGGVYSS